MSNEYRIGENGARRISPAKLSHAVLRTTRLKEMVEWYKAVLNAEVLYQNDFLVFMTYDEEHHRIALAAVPGLVEKPKRSAGLDHLAFLLELRRLDYHVRAPQGCRHNPQSPNPSWPIVVVVLSGPRRQRRRVVN